MIGFCLGGGFAVLLAGTSRYAAASVNYGGVPQDAEALLAEAFPIIGSYGSRDRTLRSDPDRLRDALASHGVPHDVTAYDGAGHSFLNDHASARCGGVGDAGVGAGRGPVRRHGVS